MMSAEDKATRHEYIYTTRLKKESLIANPSNLIGTVIKSYVQDMRGEVVAVQDSGDWGEVAISLNYKIPTLDDVFSAGYQKVK